jgi:hypothetical protein
MNKKIIIGAASVVVTLIIGILVYSFVIPKAFIQFSIAPENVFMDINGSSKTVKNGDKIRLTPGDYKITLSASGFSTYSTDITLKNNQTFELLAALTPQTDAAKQLLLNDNSQAVMQRFYGQQASAQSDIILKNYPIVSILPIQARLYEIAACSSQKYPSDTTKIALCVTESQPGLDPYVLKDISSRGYDPNNYEIIWIHQY